MPGLIPGDIRTNIVPVADLDLQGDTGQPLQLYKDVDVDLVILSLLQTNGPKAARAGLAGGLLASLQTDAGLILGVEANLWANVAVGINGLSAVFDTQDAPNVGVMGNSSGATNLTVQFSMDNITFYGTTVIAVAGAGNFVSTFTMPFRFLRLSSSAAVTLTATAAAKK